MTAIGVVVYSALVILAVAAFTVALIEVWRNW